MTEPIGTQSDDNLVAATPKEDYSEPNDKSRDIKPIGETPGRLKANNTTKNRHTASLGQH